MSEVILAVTLLWASNFVSFAVFADEPAAIAAPLILEFESYGIRQEIIVAEGSPFEVTTIDRDNHRLKVSGHVGRIHDEQVELVLTIRRERSDDDGAHSLAMHLYNLSFGTFLQGDMYNFNLPFFWIRRGADPVPTLLSSIRRLDKNSIIAVRHLSDVKTDISGLVPELVRLARGHDDVGRKESALTDAEWHELRVQCTTALGHTAPGSSAVVDALQTMMAGDDEDELRIAAAISLWKLSKHPDVTAFLADRLSSSEEHIRVGALDALAMIGEEAPIAGPSIVPLLNDQNMRIRASAAWALWRTARDPRAVDTLIAALPADDVYAVEKLGMIGYPAAQRSAPLLAEMVFQEHPDHVATALRRVDPDARCCLPLIAQAIRRNEKRDIEGASKALASYGSRLIPALNDLLQNGDEPARRLACYTLWLIGPDAVETFAEALHHNDPQVRRDAARWLRDFQKDAAPAVPALVKALNDDDETVRVDAAVALEMIGEPAVIAVQQELNQGNERTQKWASEILKHIKEIAEMDSRK